MKDSTDISNYRFKKASSWDHRKIMLVVGFKYAFFILKSQYFSKFCFNCSTHQVQIYFLSSLVSTTVVDSNYCTTLHAPARKCVEKKSVLIGNPSVKLQICVNIEYVLNILLPLKSQFIKLMAV